MKTYNWPANSALFHIVKGSIFIRDKLAFKVKEVYSDQNYMNLRIQNETRLKDLTYKEIHKRYNDRIQKYHLNYSRISDKNNLKIVKFKLIRSSFKEDEEDSGTFSIYPRVFVCGRCSRYRYFRTDESVLIKCETPGCNGKYEQLSLLKYCETCGKVEEFYYRCSDRDRHPQNSHELMRLNRKERDNIGTWRFRCDVCGLIRDPFNMECNHRDPDGTSRSNEPPTKCKPLTVREGSIFSPVVITTVDLPNTESIGLPDAEFVMLGISFGFFEDLTELLIPGQSMLDLIEKMYLEYKDESLKKRELIDFRRMQTSASVDQFEQYWKEKKYINMFENVINSLKQTYEAEEFNKVNFNNFNALKGLFKSDNCIKSYKEFCNEKLDADKNIKLAEYDKLKEQFKIADLNYLPRIKLISSCIGFINGINKFYESGFVPHFEPIWKDNNKQYFNIYSYPYETEGILIEFNKDKIVEWLQKNNLITENTIDSNKILLNLKEGSKAYDATYTLLHTLSHLLLRNASAHTGIDADSCGEKIFANNCAILLYATGNINTGGFQFLFENSLYQLFNEINVNLNKCIYDPLCKKKDGACFSCLFLAEHVCCNFNRLLDRDVLLGEGYRGITAKFWTK